MKLWLLRPVKNLPKGDDPWTPWYNKTFGFVIAAPTAYEARILADTRAGDENRGEFMGHITAHTTHPWLDATYSTARVLTVPKQAGIIMKDHSAA